MARVARVRLAVNVSAAGSLAAIANPPFFRSERAAETTCRPHLRAALACAAKSCARRFFLACMGYARFGAALSTLDDPRCKDWRRLSEYEGRFTDALHAIFPESPAWLLTGCTFAPAHCKRAF